MQKLAPAGPAHEMDFEYFWQDEARRGPVSRILSKGLPPLDGHSSGRGVAPAPQAANPDVWGRSQAPGLPPRHPYSALLPGGACRAAPVASRAVGSYPTVSPLLRPKGRSGFISVALSVGSLRPGVTRHRGFVESGLSSNGCPPAAIQPSAHPPATLARRRVQALTDAAISAMIAQSRPSSGPRAPLRNLSRTACKSRSSSRSGKP